MDLGGFKLLRTDRIRQRVMKKMSEDLQGVSGRWTFLTQLYNNQYGSADKKIAATVFAIDSA